MPEWVWVVIIVVLIAIVLTLMLRASGILLAARNRAPAALDRDRGAGSSDDDGAGGPGHTPSGSIAAPTSHGDAPTTAVRTRVSRPRSSTRPPPALAGSVAWNGETLTEGRVASDPDGRVTQPAATSPQQQTPRRRSSAPPPASAAWSTPGKDDPGRSDT